MKDGQRPAIYRYAFLTRASHWLWVLAFFVLVGSGLQIFNASPNLDASDKSDPHRRVLAIGSPADGVGTTTIFGHTFTTTGWLGWTNDGMGSRGAHAFSSTITIPGFQDLAGGRRWHFFFAWIAGLCWLAWLISTAIKGNLRDMILRPSDLPKLWPMQAYYLKLRKTPPPYGIYNPLQKASYTAVLFVVAPLVVLTGLALSPGIDAIANPLTVVFGGRQFARLWHFAGMLALADILRRPYVPGGDARRRQSDALDDHGLVSNGMKRRLFIASSVSALAGCGPLTSGLSQNGGFMRALASVEGLNHRLIGTRGLAREYRERDVDRVFRVNGFATPSDAHYASLSADAFTSYRLIVDGAVARPRAFTLAQLERMPQQTQITRHDCVEGWSAIGKWSGVRARWRARRRGAARRGAVRNLSLHG